MFLVVSALAVGAALVVLVHRNPVIGALFLVTNLMCVAVLFLLLGAPFLAAIQVIVYAGAIMVLILFVIMLLNLRRELRGIDAGGVQKLLGAAGAAAFLVLVARAVLGMAPHRRISDGAGSVEMLGERLFQDYYYPFEAVSLILLVAMAGAVVLAKRKL